MKLLVKVITRIRLVDGINPCTLINFIYADGSIVYKWQTATSTLLGFGLSEYLNKLKYIRDIKLTVEGYEEPYQMILTKYKDGKITQTIIS